jgi:hypothetical protein
MFMMQFGWGALALGLLFGQEAGGAQAPGPAATPAVILRPTQRDGEAASVREGTALTGGGAVAVTQPSPDRLLLTLTGVAAAKSNPFILSHALLDAKIDQEFEVIFPAGAKPARLILEGRVSGLLRSDDGKCCGHAAGTAELIEATAGVHCGDHPLGGVTLPVKTVAGRDAVAVNLAAGPVCLPVGPGCHTLVVSFKISAGQGKGMCSRVASAEFAPPPALPPAWIRAPDPFGGLDRSGLGFQVAVRVEPVPDDQASPSQQTKKAP